MAIEEIAVVRRNANPFVDWSWKPEAPAAPLWDGPWGASTGAVDVPEVVEDGEVAGVATLVGTDAAGTGAAMGVDTGATATGLGAALDVGTRLGASAGETEEVGTGARMGPRVGATVGVPVATAGTGATEAGTGAVAGGGDGGAAPRPTGTRTPLIWKKL